LEAESAIGVPEMREIPVRLFKSCRANPGRFNLPLGFQIQRRAKPPRTESRRWGE
jgi:hypothetical protein